MKLQNFEPQSRDEWMQIRNQQSLASVSLTHTRAVNSADSTAIANIDTAVAFDTGYTIERKLLATGQAVRLYVAGKYSTKAGSTPTLTLDVKIGGVLLCSTGAVTLGDGVTDKAFVLRPTLQCRVAGDSGQVVAFLEASFDGQAVHRPAGTPAAVSTNVDLPVEIIATWGTADADNTATLQMLTAEQL